MKRKQNDRATSAAAPEYHSRIITSPGPGKFVCELCEKTFGNSNDLEDHVLEAHPAEGYAVS